MTTFVIIVGLVLLTVICFAGWQQQGILAEDWEQRAVKAEKEAAELRMTLMNCQLEEASQDREIETLKEKLKGVET